jgi:hypothetical protein
MYVLRVIQGFYGITVNAQHVDLEDEHLLSLNWIGNGGNTTENQPDH